MHQAAYDALGLDWQYDLLPVEPERLRERVTELIAVGYRGFNVTIPHKRAVLDLPEIAYIDPAVEAMQAANTLVVQEDKTLAAYNTDWRGFGDDLAANDIAIAGADCLILGTGGSAQAVAYAMRQGDAASVTFASRQPGQRADVIGYDALGERQIDLIVNTTPVGMWPDVNESPWPDGIPFPAQAVVYDLIYNPAATRLMRDALNSGLKAYGGLGMLIIQGGLSFQHWVGMVPPWNIMRRATWEILWPS